MKVNLSFIGRLFLLLLMGISPLFFNCCSKEKTVLTLDTGEQESRIKEQQESAGGSVLNIAIGAMLSPEVTRIYYTEMLEIVAEKMGSSLYVHQRRTYTEINNMVESRTVDLALVCTGAYVKGHEDFNMEILVVPVSKGETVYYSYFIVNKSSEIDSLADLRNKTFAFTDPQSNTGCLIPTYTLYLINEVPETFFDSTFFTYSHDNSIKAVAEGLADGAAVDSLIWDYLNEEDDPYTAATRIIAKSEPYGIPPVVVHPDLDPEKKRQLKQIFISLHEDAAAFTSMKEIRIEKFVEGSDSMYQNVRTMIERLNPGEPDG